MKTWCVKVGVEDFRCPVQSPDLKPTENLWDELELKPPHLTSAPEHTNAHVHTAMLQHLMKGKQKCGAD